MSGIGKRFIDAGYKDPKPLIKVEGKPIIEHVVNLFPGENDFIFICNELHLLYTDMHDILKKIKPSCTIVGIEPHKLGPVHALSYVHDLIDPKEEVIVNYCDFGTHWDYKNFLKVTRKRKADGAIPAYKGFHPHMLGSDNYAFMREKNKWMLEIQEKKPFTDNKMNEYASNGTYYFRTGAILEKYCEKLIKSGEDLNGEFYVSCVYSHLIKDKLKVSIYEIDHMLQWGTPKDLEEYNTWSNYFNGLAERKRKRTEGLFGTKLIPLAGLGSRFTDKGYKVPKPLIEVNGKPMVIQATDCLPTCTQNVFVCLDNHLTDYKIDKTIKQSYQQGKIISLNEVTNGQACTIEYGLKEAKIKPSERLVVGTCDNGLYTDKKIPNADVVVYTFRNNTAVKNNPNMYSYVKVDKNNNILGVSMKEPISDKPEEDHAIVGSFVFKKSKYFIDGLNNMYEKGIIFNNEYYADLVIEECVKMGLKVKAFEVEYMCWGTPDDYETYKYWQSYFHKCKHHKYTIDKDPTMYKVKIKELKKEIMSTKEKKI
jgi:NDP-sugar pyrophosphorylase family protein